MIKGTHEAKIPRKSTWDEIYHDTHEALMVRRLSLYRFHFISAFDWEDATGEESPAGKYHFELQEVDLPYVRLDTVRSAVVAHGGNFELLDLRMDDGPYHQHIAECLRSYGSYAPLHQEDGNNWDKLTKCMKRVSREVAGSPAAYNARMTSTVNKIGNTAWDFMTGIVWNGRNRENLRTVPVLTQEYIAVLEEKLEEKDRQIVELTERLQKRVA